MGGHHTVEKVYKSYTFMVFSSTTSNFDYFHPRTCLVCVNSLRITCSLSLHAQNVANYTYLPAKSLKLEGYVMISTQFWL